MRRPSGLALLKQWIRGLKFAVGLGNFANELRERAGQEVRFFLRVNRDLCLCLDHNKEVPVMFLSNMILAVIRDKGGYFVADCHGSVIILDGVSPEFRPEYHLNIKVAKGLLENGWLEIIPDQEVKMPDQRITAIVLSNELYEAMQTQSKNKVEASKAAKASSGKPAPTRVHNG